MQRAQESLGDQPARDTPCAVLNADLVLLLCLEAWAQRDRQGSRGTERPGRRRRLASLGLSTIARLLAGCEPYRVRWSLQHVPYPVAKRVRSIMSVAPTMSDQVRRLESAVLKAAWTRLKLENRLSVRHPDETMRPDHAC